MIELTKVFDKIGRDYTAIFKRCKVAPYYLKRLEFWQDNPDIISFSDVLRVMIMHGLSVEETFTWKPDKGAKMAYIKWQDKMKSRWDRYRRQRIYEELTDTKQNWPLSFKLELMHEYFTTDISMRELSEKYGVPKEKIICWFKKNYQV